jgi:hypothetical protein
MPMMNILRDQRSSLMAQHASIILLVAVAVAAVGLLMGLGAADLYETANSWVLRA